MIRPWGSRCAGHRVALVDFVDRREAGPAIDAALEHLDRCRACEGELTDIALAIVALRRIHRETRDVEPAREAWVRIRARITGRPVALWRWRMTLAGLMTSASLVGALVGPLAIEGARHGAPIRETLIETVAPGMGTISPDDARIETQFVIASRAPGARPGSGSAAVIARDDSRILVARIYPDGIRPERKEVDSAEPSWRPPESS